MRLETVAEAEQVGMGWWGSPCCHLDLSQIRDEDQLEDARASAQDNEDDEGCGFFQDAWPTLRDALEAIAARGMVDLTSGSPVPFTRERFYQEFRDVNTMWRHRG